MLKKYLITDPVYYSSTPLSLVANFQKNIAFKKPNMALLRDNQTSNYRALAEVFVPFLKSIHVESILHSDVKLALALNACGVHLPFRLLDSVKVAKESGLFVVVSTHSLDEALRAEDEGASAITFSPIFYTPDRKSVV